MVYDGIEFLSFSIHKKYRNTEKIKNVYQKNGTIFYAIDLIAGPLERLNIPFRKPDSYSTKWE